MSIPINFPDALRGEIKEILLFASWDQGRTYEQVATVLPDKKEFAFEARNDGICWLRVAVVNRQGKQEPDNILQAPPNQKIVIDTIKPVMRTFSAQRQADEAVVAWEILEDHPDSQGFRLEYQPKDNPSAFWTPIQAPPALTGQARFRPSSSGPLVVRLIVKDLAGNQSFATAEAAGANAGPINTVSHSQPAASAPSPMSTAIPPPAPPPSSFGTDSAPPPLLVESVKQPAPPNNSNNWAPTPAAALEPKGRPIATSQAPPLAMPPAPAAPEPSTTLPPSAPPRKPLPPLQYVNHPNVLLEYELSKVGKSGIGSVDLWWTRNNGESWELYAKDQKIAGSTRNGKQEATVELPGEGVYGFILVVKSRAGLGKKAPKADDIPEIRVEVDTTLPFAELYPATPDHQHPGALILNWVAKDNNLANTPITLEWAENREGKWNNIAVNIPNTGSYSWQLPDTLPVQVYLRLRVRDLAGNESVAATQDPQLVDLNEPEGKIISASAVSR